jgi:hemolysin III
MSQATEKSKELIEEVVNAATHGIGLVLSIAGLVYLLYMFWSKSSVDFVSTAIFGGTLVLMYGASTMYHAWREGRIKQWLRQLDHAAIFLLIAGTYTPFTLGVLEPEWGLPVFVIVWLAAVVGVAFKFVDIDRLPFSNRAIFLAIGWLAVVLIYPLATTLSLAAFGCLIAGGLAYSVGTIFYGWEGLRFNHGVWHLFVLAGSAFHYSSVVMAVGI